MAECHSTKYCATCQKSFPATTDYWHCNRNSRDGLAHSCKSCAKARAKQWRKKNREYHRAYSKQWRIENPEKKKQQQREWYERNHQYCLQQSRKWWAENNEYARRRCREWYRGNKEYVKQNVQKWRAKNKDYVRKRERKWRKENRDKDREYSRRWRERNPEKSRLKNRTDAHKRRSRLNNTSGDGITEEGIQRKWESQNGLCWHCQTHLNEQYYHLDHLIPLSRGGSNESRNIVLSCPECNSSKRDKLPSEWSGRLF